MALITRATEEKGLEKIKSNLRSDEILQRSFGDGRGLTKSERGELREAYMYEQRQKEQAKHAIQTASKKPFEEDMNNLPRHQTNCTSFVECPIDFKCRNYNPSYLACTNCKLHETEGICHKTQDLHREQYLDMFFTSRERVDLDGEEK